MNQQADHLLGGAWDSYIQGTNTGGMDAGQMWPMNLESALDTGGQQQQGQQQSQQQQSGMNGGLNGSSGIFMGATTPGGSTNMM